MPFTDNLPPENTNPWYAGITTAWANLKTFVNGLETSLGDKATAAQGAKADTAVQPAAIANFVPNTRTVAGKPLTANVTLAPADVGAATAAQGAKADTAVQPAALTGKENTLTAGANVTIDRTNPAAPIISASGGGGGGAVDSVNGQTGVVVLAASDVGAATTAQGALAATAVQPAAIANFVPNTRTVAGKALTSNVTLVPADVGAATAAQGAKADTAVQPAGLTKTAVGLGNVDNTSDANKPVSTAQAAAIGLKVSTADSAALDTVGWGRAVYIENGGTVPGGTPPYTIVIEAG